MPYPNSVNICFQAPRTFGNVDIIYLRRVSIELNECRFVRGVLLGFSC